MNRRKELYGRNEADAQTEAATIEQLAERLEKNEHERKLLLRDVEALLEQAEKTREIASHLLARHDGPQHAPGGGGY